MSPVTIESFSLITTKFGVAKITGCALPGARLSHLCFRYISCSHAGITRLSTTTTANPARAAAGKLSQTFPIRDKPAVMNKEAANTCNECLPNRLKNLNRRSVISFRSTVLGIHQIT
jgi:hypothetical protein